MSLSLLRDLTFQLYTGVTRYVITPWVDKIPGDRISDLAADFSYDIFRFVKVITTPGRFVEKKISVMPTHPNKDNPNPNPNLYPNPNPNPKNVGCIGNCGVTPLCKRLQFWV